MVIIFYWSRSVNAPSANQPLFNSIAYITHLDPASAGDLTFANTKFTHQSNCIPLRAILAGDIFVFRVPGRINLAALLNNSVTILILNFIVLPYIRTVIITKIFVLPAINICITNNARITRNDTNGFFTSNSLRILSSTKTTLIPRRSSADVFPSDHSKYSA